MQRRSWPYLTALVLLDESRTKNSGNQNDRRRARLIHAGGIEPTQIRRRVTVARDRRPGEHCRPNASQRDHHAWERTRHFAAHHHSSHDMRVPFGRRHVLPPRHVHRSPCLATPYIPTQGATLLFIIYMTLIPHVYARTFSVF